jgi:hypothetical protein
MQSFLTWSGFPCPKDGAPQGPGNGTSGRLFPSTTGQRTNDAKVEMTHAALAGIRVVDMSGWSGQYCGKQFADLGAEVILVEPSRDFHLFRVRMAFGSLSSRACARSRTSSCTHRLIRRCGLGVHFDLSGQVLQALVQ